MFNTEAVGQWIVDNLGYKLVHYLDSRLRSRVTNWAFAASSLEP